MKAFYFSNKERKLRYDDNRVIRNGRTHKVNGEIKLCGNGLHASESLIDASFYAPSSILWHVELGGTIVHGGDKVAASERTYLASFDATKLLDEFSRKQAMIHIEKIKSHCTSDEYDLIVSWLETGDEDIRGAARNAAKTAADLAAKSVAFAVAPSTYWAAKSAYWAARWAAHVSDSYETHMEEANKMLTDMVREAAGWEI